MNVAIWKLAADTSTYGDHSEWYLLVSPDGEDELAGPFQYEDEAEAFAESKGWTVIYPEEENERQAADEQQQNRDWNNN